MKPEMRIQITGTRTNRLRARVQVSDEPRFEVTLGGNEWTKLNKGSPRLCARILEYAERYVQNLSSQLSAL